MPAPHIKRLQVLEINKRVFTGIIEIRIVFFCDPDCPIQDGGEENNFEVVGAYLACNSNSLSLVTIYTNVESKKISNDQELIQSDPISCPQNQKGNN